MAALPIRSDEDQPLLAPSVDAEDLGFYQRLSSFTNFEAVADPRSYTDVPSSWCVVLSDIKGSTKAIEEGRYKDVNTLGAATIISAINSIQGIEVPYVFGGDGATLVVPMAARNRVIEALRATQTLAASAFNLVLRVGVVPVAEIQRSGHAIRVAKFRMSSSIDLAMFSGGGLTYAEKVIKSGDGGRYLIEPGDRDKGNYAGLECRWQPVPSQQGEIVTLIVKASSSDAEQAGRVYREVLGGIASIFQNRPASPIGFQQLKVGRQAKDLMAEARVRFFEKPYLPQRLHILFLKFICYFGERLMRLGRRWNNYKDELIDNTDCRKFDDVLRMVLDANRSERKRLEDFLERCERQGQIVYGLHVASEALLTCLVFNRRGKHLHFVDGNDGGYALAAKALKAKLAA